MPSSSRTDAHSSVADDPGADHGVAAVEHGWQAMGLAEMAPRAIPVVEHRLRGAVLRKSVRNSSQAIRFSTAS
jgi:hypothetical protein